MTDINAVAQQFAGYYYRLFFASRNELASLYQPQSVLSFEGQTFQGPQGIVEKLVTLPPFKAAPEIDTMDVQLTNPQTGSILICMTGRLLIENESVPQRFCQTFVLMPAGGSFFISNDVFRLNYG